MYKYDFHTHTDFSGDCEFPMEIMIEHAINNNFKKLCFTDHFDYDFPSTELSFQLDIPAYYNKFMELKEKYNSKIDLLFGIEVGIQPHIYDVIIKTINKYPFDFVIGSTHVINKQDPYCGEYYKNKTKKEAYDKYLKEILYNVNNFNDYNVYGHLDYIIRYGNYEDKKLYYKDYSDIIDAILLKIIESNHGIEINTSGYRQNFKEPHPNVDIIKRYGELGGEIITIGSDSHNPEHLAYNFDKACNLLLKNGFKYFTVFKERKPEFIKIPCV
ncbi:MAG: histidinol-phosphatase HisJ family protein [Vallitalea sp.]|jgi:histidinol-phosphatase (PHP family)|nr:histidinol-phosphatase HisJ family protein [Vallitalea sp.]